MSSSNTTEIKRYAAKLLFQWRIETDGVSDKMRTCEEQIIIIEAETPFEAIKKVKKRAKGQEFRKKNSKYSKKHNCICIVFYEFVGIQELLFLDNYMDEDEVWYDVKKYLTPRERKDSLIPKEQDLFAVIEFREKRQSS
ncbi:MAG: DUF4288 domain-containing protein [Alphaproteobacteria bacterium]|nr:DUF4288 domain-containing protein [Alphaproteobacteria bacterium]MCB9975565.1 DUF4288 domain-containing protein [Rhodospirillales bacterium]